MDLKNAVVVCLISLFSATIVVLIARSLDSHSASQLEPHLIRIADELETLRKQGGVAAASGSVVASESPDELVVYYFHGNVRCPTCRTIESQAHEAVKTQFASELKSGQIAWKTLNYEQPAGSQLKKKFDIQVPVIVLARKAGGEITGWNRLDRVWPLVGDKPEFIEYVQTEIKRMMEHGEEPSSDALNGNEQPLWTPNVDPDDLPLPSAPPNIPVPE